MKKHLGSIEISSVTLLHGNLKWDRLICRLIQTPLLLIHRFSLIQYSSLLLPTPVFITCLCSVVLPCLFVCLFVCFGFFVVFVLLLIFGFGLFYKCVAIRNVSYPLCVDILYLQTC
jgi:hypothetical protein